MGFIRTITEVKLVILYILCRLSYPVSQLDLTAAAQVDDGFTYFDSVQAVAELLTTKHIEESTNTFYLITEKGRSDSETTEKDIPYSVRLKLDANIDILRKEMERSRMIAVMRDKNI